jgi:hypothetical protein
MLKGIVQNQFSRQWPSRSLGAWFYLRWAKPGNAALYDNLLQTIYKVIVPDLREREL